jgi:hypothetical protein
MKGHSRAACGRQNTYGAKATCTTLKNRGELKWQEKLKSEQY